MLESLFFSRRLHVYFFLLARARIAVDWSERHVDGTLRFLIRPEAVRPPGGTRPRTSRYGLVSLVK